MKHLLARRSAAAQLHGGAVIIDGEPGAGKSRLMREFRSRAENARTRIATGECRKFGQPPLGAFAEILQRLSLRYPQVFAGDPVLQWLATSLTSGEPPANGAQRAVSRNEQFAMLVRAFERLAQERTIVAIVEDLHWADSVTIEFLRVLARAATHGRLLVLASIRLGDVARNTPAYERIGALLAEPAITRVLLTPLPAATIRMLLEENTKNSPMPVSILRHIERSCDGNPFFAEELLRSAVDHQRDTAQGETLPISIRALVLERFFKLEQQERTIVSLAAILGKRFSYELIASMVGTGIDSALERACALQLIEPVASEASPAYTFRHALTREVIVAEVSAELRRQLHTQIMLAIENRADAQTLVADLAYHAWHSGDRQRSARYSEAAAFAAAQVHAHEEAVQLFERAIASRSDDSQHARLYERIGELLNNAGEPERALAAFKQALDCHRKNDNADETARLARLLAREQANLGDEAGAKGTLVGAIAELRGTHRHQHKVELTLDLVWQHLNSREFDAAERLVEDLKTIDLADVRQRLRLHDIRMMIGAGRLRKDIVREEFHNASRLFAQAAYPGRQATILVQYAIALTDLGDAESGLACTQAADFARQHGILMMLREALAFGSYERLLRGDLAGARDRLEAAAAIDGKGFSSRIYLARSGVLLGLRLGDDAFAQRYFDRELLTDLMARQLYVPLLLIAGPFATLLALQGDSNYARQVLKTAIAAPNAPRVGFQTFLAIAAFAPKLVSSAREQLALAVQNPDDRLSGAALALFDALVAQVNNDRETARLSGDRAYEAFDALGWHLYAADALVCAEDIDRAVSIYRASGSVGDVRRLEAATTDTSTTRWSLSGCLSRRERAIVDLAMRGMRNRSIAGKLDIGEKMVEKHLSSAYRKLGISGRSELTILFGKYPSSGWFQN